MIRYKICTVMYDGESESCMGDIKEDGPNGSRCDTCDKLSFDDLHGQEDMHWVAFWDLKTTTIGVTHRSDIEPLQFILAMAVCPDTIEEYADHLQNSQHPEFAFN